MGTTNTTSGSGKLTSAQAKARYEALADKVEKGAKGLPALEQKIAREVKERYAKEVRGFEKLREEKRAAFLEWKRIEAEEAAAAKAAAEAEGDGEGSGAGEEGGGEEGAKHTAMGGAGKGTKAEKQAAGGEEEDGDGDEDEGGAGGGEKKGEGAADGGGEKGSVPPIGGV